jgi:hypothetical protein
MNADNRGERIRLGVAESSGEPFQFPISSLGHLHCRGMSGSGKTSLTLIPLAAQLIRFGYPTFIIDLGGDISMFHNLKRVTEREAAATRSKRGFRAVMLDPLLSSHCFPPFQRVAGVPLSITEVSQRLLRGFNLDFGAAQHGPTYYAAQALAAILSVSQKVFAVNPDASLAEVDHFLNLPSNKREFRDADSIRMSIRFLLQYPQFSTHEDPEQNVQIERAITEREVCYFFFPSLDDPVVSPLAGGLVLATIIYVASVLFKLGKPLPPTYIVVDEFSEIVGRSLAALLAQGRKYGLRFILANQSTSQLENRDTKLSDALFEGTTVKQYFTCVGDEDTKVLQSVSKDKVRSLGGTTVSGLSTSVSFKEYISPALDRDEILRVSATQGLSFVLLNDGRGHHEPYVVKQTHGEFPDLSGMPMPLRSAESRPQVSPPVSAISEQRASEPSRKPSINTELDRRIAALIAVKQAAERWEIVGGK